MAPTPPPTAAQLQVQLDRLKTTGFDVLLANAATANSLPIPFLFAIASRETNCRNILGDTKADGPHGVGIIQIDIQHPIARVARDSGSWKTNPVPLIEFGAKLLAADIIQVQHNLPALTGNDVLKVAASGYRLRNRPRHPGSRLLRRRLRHLHHWQKLRQRCNWTHADLSADSVDKTTS